MKGKKRSISKLNNSGAALVLVIVVISFISISATMLLYMSAMNFYMKTTDARTKVSFYEGEKALEEVKAVLISVASDASVEAYQEVVMTVGATDPADSMDEYKAKFMTKFITKWEKLIKDSNDSSVTDYNAAVPVQNYLRGVVDAKYNVGDNLSLVGGFGFLPDGTPNPKVYDKTSSGDKFLLRTVEFSYTTDEGYLTKITTDFVVTVPVVNFSMDPDVATRDTINAINYVTYSNWTKN